ncbi:MAG TPA: chemotaxis protein CheW [Candidatus Thermoplasmatota archaeon]|nr:chemotaxis protein CheW [Candidatus Thermoplasmatota archaeon]
MSDGAFVVFSVGGQVFAAPVADVREIVAFERATRVPRAPPDVVGLLDLRGQVLTAVDLARRLGLARGVASRVLVLATDGPPVGALVDDVLDVLRTTTAAAAGASVHAPDGRPARVLDLRRALGEEHA